jgi:prophage regulatory protein
MTDSILRLPSVKTNTGLSRSTIYLRIAQGEFPKPVSLGGRAVGWPASEVAALNAARIAGKSNSEIRELVVTLEAARMTVALHGGRSCLFVRHSQEYRARVGEGWIADM